MPCLFINCDERMSNHQRLKIRYKQLFNFLLESCREVISTLQLDKQLFNMSLTAFHKEVIERMKDYPFYCTVACENYTEVTDILLRYCFDISHDLFCSETEACIFVLLKECILAGYISARSEMKLQ